MADFIVSEITDPFTAWNGEYSESGTFNGKPAYTNGTAWLFYSIMYSGYWSIDADPNFETGGVFGGDSTSPLTSAGAWTAMWPFGTPVVISGGPPTYDISGTILDEHGDPVEGATVTGTASGEDNIVDTTDANGDYTLEDCADETTWTVTPTLTGWTFTPESDEAAISGSNIADIDFKGALTFPTAPANWLTGWGYRAQFLVEASKVGTGGVSDFPVLLTGDNLPSTFWDNVDSAGDDIRITDDSGNTVLSHELVKIDVANEILEIWFKGDLSDESNNLFCIYYGNASAEAPTDQEDTWSNNYIAVWHHAQASGDTPDSTGNGLTAVLQGNTAPNQTGKVGKAVTLDGNGDYLRVTDDSVLKPDYITLEAWVKQTAGVNWAKAISKPYNDDVNDSEPFISYSIAPQDHPASVSMEVCVSGTRKEANVGGSLGTDWHFIAGTYDGSNVKAYLDGSFGSATSAEGVIAYEAGEETHDIGLGQENPHTPNSNWFNGLLDEQRISSIARSEIWLDTCYLNQSSPATFSYLGSEEAAPNETVGPFPTFLHS